MQTIKKESDSVSQYLHRIKEARDYLSAAGVHFADEDIVILALNGLPAEYNTFRCVIRGRESVISLKDFRSQLLAEEAIVENSITAPFMTAMVANTSSPTSKDSGSQSRGFSHSQGQAQFATGGFKPFHGNKNKGKGRFGQGSRVYNARSGFSPPTNVFSNPGILGQSPSPQFGSPSLSPMVQICQLCNLEGHNATFCGSPSVEKNKCHICGRSNHTTWFCFYNDKGPNYLGMHNTGYSQQPPYPMSSQNVNYSQQPSYSQFQTQQSPMHPMHTVLQPSAPSTSVSPTAPQVWLTDSGATNHMTADLSNLSLASPYPTNETIQTANGEGLTVSHVGSSIIRTPVCPLNVPQLTQNLLSVHRICLDNN